MSIIQSAAGYGGLEATPLARPGYYNKIISRVYERDFLSEITNSEINERILDCNQSVQIMRAPEVGEWQTYQKNQELVPNQISFDATCLQICNAAYTAIKFEEIDVRFACDRWASFEEKFLEEIYQKYVALQRRWVLMSMLAETSEQNQGANAGVFGDIDLGTPSNPVVVNKDNLPRRLADLQRVLLESQRWTEGQMFILLPPALRPILAMSNLADASYVGSCKPCSYNVDGMWNVTLGGFNIIETIHAPTVINSDGTVSYYIIAGHSSAFAYVSDIIKGRLVAPTNSFSLEYQMLAVWGGKMIYPDAIAVALWKFDNT